MLQGLEVGVNSLKQRLQSGSLASTSCSSRPVYSAPRLGASTLLTARRHACIRTRSADRDLPPPPPMPPPPPPPSAAQASGQTNVPQQGDNINWKEVKERYLRRNYLPATFVFTSLTFGLRMSAENFTFADDPVSYIGCAVSTGLLFTALAWVLFDFTDNPPSGGNFSSPR